MRPIMVNSSIKAASASLTSLFASASLTTRFAVYSFLCIGLMSGVLWLIVSHYLIGQILEREWKSTAQMVRGDVRKFLEDYDFKAQDRKSVGHKFVALLDYMRLSPEIVRFKVYNPKGVVIWSDDKRLVGKSFNENVQLRKALQGAVISNLGAWDERENLYESKPFSTVVQVYVPIYSDNQQELLGVFEAYRRADSIFAHIREARFVVLLGAVGGGLLVYLSLLVIVRQAARQIDEQQIKLLKMQSELIATQRMAAVGEMAAAVAHGIGNPLSSIRAAAQVALLESEAEDRRETNGKMHGNLQSIMRQVDRVQKRMQGLLNFAKPLEPHPVSLEVNALVRDVVETMNSRFKDAGVQSNVDLDSTLPGIVFDLNHLEQALMVLITNALEATPKGGTVTIRTKWINRNGDGNAIQVAIEDSGEGIPAENRERVFDPFFTTKPHGTGIGLPLAKKFLERNGGKIALTHGRDHGTRVEIILPLSA